MITEEPDMLGAKMKVLNPHAFPLSCFISASLSSTQNKQKSFLHCDLCFAWRGWAADGGLLLQIGSLEVLHLRSMNG